MHPTLRVTWSRRGLLMLGLVAYCAPTHQMSRHVSGAAGTSGRFEAENLAGRPDPCFGSGSFATWWGRGA